MNFSTIEQFMIAHAAMVLAVYIPAAVLFWVALCLARTRKDPARSGLSYLKLAFATFGPWCFFDIGAFVINVVYARLRFDGTTDDIDLTGRGMRALIFSVNVLSSAARLFDSITQLLVFMMLLRLTTGIVMIKTGKPDAVGKISKIASYVSFFVMIALAISAFALRIKYYFSAWASTYVDLTGNSFHSSIAQFNQARQIDFAFSVLLFILAILVIARAVMVKLQTKDEPLAGYSSNLVLACSSLWLLLTTYYMAAFAATANLKNFRQDPPYPNYYLILDVVLYIWPTFVILVIAFALSKKKQGGLWSTNQPFLNNALNTGGTTQQTAWGYGANAYEQTAYNQTAAQGAVSPVNQEFKQPSPPAPVQTGWVPQQQQTPQQQGYYAPAPAPQQDQQLQQHQHQYQQRQSYHAQYHSPTSPQNSQHASFHAYTPVSHSTVSPPPLEDAMGLNHQANGTAPQNPPRAYEKS